jgi:hypothetical protein
MDDLDSGPRDDDGNCWDLSVLATISFMMALFAPEEYALLRIIDR